MRSEPSLLRRMLIRLVYLLPAISWLCVLIHACIPHLYFVYNDIAQETVSIFDLMGNTWKECIGFFDGTANGTPADLIFSYIMVFFVVLMWTFIVWCGIFALSCAGCSHYAFGKSPTDKYTNRAKKFFYLVCPNRICYVLFSVFLPLPALFPQLLTFLYDRQLGLTVHLFSFGPMNWILGVILGVLCIGGFLGTLTWQDMYHLDMFRLYKGKTEPHP